MLPFGFGDLDLNQLMRMLQAGGPVNWEIATQVARHVATDGAPERPVDTAATTQLDELARAAQTHIVAETGLSATFATRVLATGRTGWVDLHLEALKPVLEALAATLGQALAGATDEPGGPGQLGLRPPWIRFVGQKAAP